MGNLSIGRALQRGWWVIVLALVVALATATAMTARTTPTYRATVTLVVTPSETVEEPDDVLRSLETLERRTIVATLARIPSSRGMKNRVADRMPMDPKALRAYRLRASVVPYTNAIEIEVTGPDPERAEAIATATAQATKAEAETLYPIYELRDFEAADSSSDPVDPDPRRNFVVGAIVGLFAGVVGAFLLEYGRKDQRTSSHSDE